MITITIRINIDKQKPPLNTYVLLYDKNGNVSLGFYDPDTIELIGGKGFFKRFKDKDFGCEIYPHDFYANTINALKDICEWSEVPDEKISGSEFRKWRRSLEISQELVAYYVGCNRSTICRWEKGELNIISDLYEKIMKFYKENKDYDSNE